MGGNSNQMVQEGLGGAQIASGAVATFMGQPEIGVPMMMGGIQGVANPKANQGPLQSGIGTAMSAGGAALGGMGGGPSPTALGGSSDIGSMMDVMGTGAGAGMDQLPAQLTQGGGIAPTSMSGMGNFNPQMLSQMMGGASQQMQQKPPMPPPMKPPTPPSMPLATNPQSIGQRIATPQASPAPQVPSPPQAPQQQNPLIQKLMQLLGGSM